MIRSLCRAGRAVGLLTTVALLALVGGCALGGQPEPDAVPVTTTPSAGPRPPPTGTATVLIYLLRDQRLEPVERRGSRSAQAVLDLLTAGPTPGEAQSGVSTALAPQLLTARPDPRDPGVVVVGVGAEFSALTGRQQLLAVGQVVWTVTSVPGIGRVRLLLDGRPIPIPTDRGLDWDAVGRSDYRSIAPVE